MNSRRKINNIVPKDGMPGFYVLHYSLNGDIRRNNNCAFHAETFMLADGEPTFESKEALAAVAKALRTSQKNLIATIKNTMK